MTKKFNIGDKVKLSYCKTEPYFVVGDGGHLSQWMMWAGVKNPHCINTVGGDFRAWLETVEDSLELLT